MQRRRERNGMRWRERIKFFRRRFNRLIQMWLYRGRGVILRSSVRETPRRYWIVYSRRAKRWIRVACGRRNGKEGVLERTGQWKATVNKTTRSISACREVGTHTLGDS